MLRWLLVAVLLGVVRTESTARAPEYISVQCDPRYLQATIAKRIPDFDRAPLPNVDKAYDSSWFLVVSLPSGRKDTFTVEEARVRGIDLYDTADHLVLRVNHSLDYVKVEQFRNIKGYKVDVVLEHGSALPLLSISIPLVCIHDAFHCNETHLVVVMPEMCEDPLEGLTINGQNVNLAALEKKLVGLQKISENSSRGYVIEISKKSPLLSQMACQISGESGTTYSLHLVLNFRRMQEPYLVRLSWACPCKAFTPAPAYFCDESTGRLAVFFGPVRGTNIILDQIEINGVSIHDLPPERAKDYIFEVDKTSEPEVYTIYVETFSFAPAVKLLAQTTNSRTYWASVKVVAKDSDGALQYLVGNMTCTFLYEKSQVSCYEDYYLLKLITEDIASFAITINRRPLAELAGMGYNVLQSGVFTIIMAKPDAPLNEIQALQNGTLLRGFKVLLLGANDDVGFTVMCPFSGSDAQCHSESLVLTATFGPVLGSQVELLQVQLNNMSLLGLAADLATDYKFGIIPTSQMGVFNVFVEAFAVGTEVAVVSQTNDSRTYWAQVMVDVKNEKEVHFVFTKNISCTFPYQKSGRVLCFEEALLLELVSADVANFAITVGGWSVDELAGMGYRLLQKGDSSIVVSMPDAAFNKLQIFPNGTTSRSFTTLLRNAYGVKEDYLVNCNSASNDILRCNSTHLVVVLLNDCSKSLLNITINGWALQQEVLKDVMMSLRELDDQGHQLVLEASKRSSLLSRKNCQFGNEQGVAYGFDLELESCKHLWPIMYMSLSCPCEHHLGDAPTFACDVKTQRMAANFGPVFGTRIEMIEMKVNGLSSDCLAVASNSDYKCVVVRTSIPGAFTVYVEANVVGTAVAVLDQTESSRTYWANIVLRVRNENNVSFDFMGNMTCIFPCCEPGRILCSEETLFLSLATVDVVGFSMTIGGHPVTKLARMGYEVLEQEGSTIVMATPDAALNDVKVLPNGTAVTTFTVTLSNDFGVVEDHKVVCSLPAKDFIACNETHIEAIMSESYSEALQNLSFNGQAFQLGELAQVLVRVRAEQRDQEQVTIIEVSKKSPLLLRQGCQAGSERGVTWIMELLLYLKDVQPHIVQKSLACPCEVEISTFPTLEASGQVVCTTDAMRLELATAAIAGFEITVRGRPLLELAGMGYSLERKDNLTIITAAPNAEFNIAQFLPNGTTVHTFVVYLNNSHGASWEYMVTCAFQTSVCAPGGYMQIEVWANSTVPRLNLAAVHLAYDQSCLPQLITSEKVVFSFPLSACGTRKVVQGAVVHYENDILVKSELVLGTILRDSEYRLHVVCEHNPEDRIAVGFLVNTIMPMLPLLQEGPLDLRLRVFHDGAFNTSYGRQEHPVLRVLREPIHLQLELHGHSDPTLELFLDDCWATSNADSLSQPQWILVADGCANGDDDYPTIFHSVTSETGLLNPPSHNKRFEVKAFAFTDASGVPLQSLVYFHCSAVVCDLSRPDVEQCKPSCVGAASPSRMLHRSLRARRASLNDLRGTASLKEPVIVMVTKSQQIGTKEADYIQRKQILMWTAGLLSITFFLIGILLLFFHPHLTSIVSI
uniref:uncharacterized protein n=1 Tax=Myxine glutinosa TaxID=7769 RepID=UPI00358EAF3B